MDAFGQLARAFRAGRPEGQAPDVEAPSKGISDAVLEAELVRVHGSARACWSGLEVDALRFVECLGRATGGDAALLASIHLGDFYLASGCALAIAPALRAFDALMMRVVPAFVAHISTESSFVDDLLQDLRERLLVASDGKAPRIASYRGTGPLEGWLRVAAVRAALDRTRKQGGERRGHPGDVVPLGPPGAELGYLKRRYGAEFKAAVEEGLLALSNEDRVMLKLRHIDGLTVERIGTMFDVHASTVVRRLANASDQVHAHARRSLRERLHLSPAEVDSLAAMVQSQIDLSLSRLLNK
jgi:RNA polymerase sigma-70 factor (ECF subfamily)